MTKKGSGPRRAKQDVMQRLPRAALEASSRLRSKWRKALLHKLDGTPKRILANVMTVLAAHPLWEGVLAYDAFAETVVCTKAPPVRAIDRVHSGEPGDWSEEDAVRTSAWFSSEIGFDPAIDMVHQAAIAIARKRQVHPVRDWLQSLDWDGVPRVDQVLPIYFGATDSVYVRAIGSKWMISAVARVFQPGCQVDCMVVLEGKQGRKKSTGFERLAGKDWFADTPMDLGSKDAYQSLSRKWIYEIAELDSFKGRDATKVKAFVSARRDKYRPSYGRRSRDFPRQLVFCGTTNEHEYLTDRSGNRRFWCVRSSRDVDVDGIGRDRDQLWAEAVSRYRSGEPWYVDTPALRALCEAEQAERVPDDPWTELVRVWLKAPTVPDDGGRRRVVDLEFGFTTTEALLGAINLRPGEASLAASIRIGHVLRDLKWLPRQVRDGDDTPRRYFISGPGDEPLHETGTADVRETGPCTNVTDVTVTFPDLGTASVPAVHAEDLDPDRDDWDREHEAGSRPKAKRPR